MTRSFAQVGVLMAAGAVAVASAVTTAGAASATPTSAAKSSPHSGWSAVSPALPQTFSGEKRLALPKRFKAYALDESALTADLAGAPLENTHAAVATALPEIAVPGPDGKLHTFRVVSSPVMQAGLAAKVTNFHSYAGRGVDDPTATGRFDLSPVGFHGTVITGSGGYDVDPAYAGSTNRYVAYSGGALTAKAPQPTDEPGEGEPGQSPYGQAGLVGTTNNRPAPGSLVEQRVYRLALASDPGYATAEGAANVDDAKAAVVNRLDQVYNTDLAIKFILVSNNNSLDFNTDAQYTAAGYPAGTACGPLRVPNQHAVDNAIGSPNYDVGFLLSSALDGGVVGDLGEVGVNGIKAEGCNGGGTDPNGDNFTVEFLAHEMGHDFSATHSFQGSSTSCPNHDSHSEIEPGSGQSIMGYSGVCGADDEQSNADPVFNQFSIGEIQTFVRATVMNSDNTTATNGGTIVTTTDHSPVVTVPATQSIPPLTPFTVTGSATDIDGDALSYVWEQNDNQASGDDIALLSNSKTSGALFSEFPHPAVLTRNDNDDTYNEPGENTATATGNVRTYPNVEDIASGNTDAATGSCPTASSPATTAQIACFTNFLPQTARTLHLDLTARDNYPSGGGVSTAEGVVNVVGSTPFAVTSTTASGIGNASSTVTWNVAGTTAAPFDVANVKISYSTDGGLTFPTVLTASVPNNGSATVTLPNTATTNGRFKVEAIGQPFFDISHNDLTVTEAAAATLPEAPYAPLLPVAGLGAAAVWIRSRRARAQK